MTNEDTTDFDEHFAKISSYIVDTLHGVPLEMTEDEKEQFRIQVISNQYAERLLSEAEKTETYRGLSKIDILHAVALGPQLLRFCYPLSAQKAGHFDFSQRIFL